ncbi:orotidine-5'-phosphate decarboxylase, partial [Patescibacteria group bacterium]|nr:orotidine-5'-phosphate decarboxylase [Patescibacteria group bacterium]
KSPLICGLDPQLCYMPPYMVRYGLEAFGKSYRAIAKIFEKFCYKTIDAVADTVVAVKPNRAFFQAYGPAGDEAFCNTVVHACNAGLLVIEDAKLSDGGDTAKAYADGHIGEVPFFDGRTIISPTRVDCVTIMPYIGEACMEPFIQRVKKFGTGIFVVTKTSFKPNSRIEQLELPSVVSAGPSVWEKVAQMVGEMAEGTEGSCGLTNVGVVMGATYPADAVKMRQILPNAWFLVPGYGGQGATAQDSVVGMRKDGLGVVVNNSRGLTYCFRDLKNKKDDFPMLCEPAGCFDMVRRKAIACRDELVASASNAGKWPF